jgi:hypothetical protein
MAGSILIGFTHIDKYIRILDSLINAFDGHFFDTRFSVGYQIMGSFNHDILEESSWEKSMFFAWHNNIG